LTGLLAGIYVILVLGADLSRLESVTLLLLATSVSSYAAMNFTGATPYTSPSGVEKEMRQGIPIQIITVIIAIITWVAAPFVS
jgi:cobalamin synthase